MPVLCLPLILLHLCRLQNSDQFSHLLNIFILVLKSLFNVPKGILEGVAERRSQIVNEALAVEIAVALDMRFVWAER